LEKESVSLLVIIVDVVVVIHFHPTKQQTSWSAFAVKNGTRTAHGSLPICLIETAAMVITLLASLL